MPYGSAKKFLRGNRCSSLRSAFSCSSTVTTRVCCHPLMDNTRLAVSLIRLRRPKIFKQLFGPLGAAQEARNACLYRRAMITL